MNSQYKPSTQQQAVIDFARTGRGHLNLVARAGTGKSSTILLTVQTLRDAGQLRRGNGAFIGAYNRPIADELQSKLNCMGITFDICEAGTWHSIGKRAWGKLAPRACGKECVNANKVSKLFGEMYPARFNSNIGITQPAYEAAFKPCVLRAVSLAKQRAFGVLCAVDDVTAWYDLFDHFGLEDDLLESQPVAEALRIARAVYKRSLELCFETIDFDDMILAPLYFRARFWTFAWVFIDEAQDTNPARRALALAILRPGGRLVAVGDDHQAIYGFTGADADSMPQIKAALGSHELPLTLTYRCSQAVVREAQQYVPDIQAHESNVEGSVTQVTLDEFNPAIVTAADAILCRKMAPLVDLAYAMIRAGLPCKIEGRELGQGLLSLAARFKLVNLRPLMTKLEEYKDKETQRLLAKEKEDRAADLADKVDTLIVIADGLLGRGKDKVTDLIEFVESLFNDTPAGTQPAVPTLCTIHRSKGREWDRVYLLGRNAYMPSKWARKEWQMQQEDNLAYVAITRAKVDLIDIVVPIERKERNA